MLRNNQQNSHTLNVNVQQGVVYGKGTVVGEDGEDYDRNLLMDVYSPSDESEGPRPAVILCFGGSFHRGGPDFVFHEGGAQDTSMSTYCHTLAQLGYVCFAIEYRLAPEEPTRSGEGYEDEDVDWEVQSDPRLIDDANVVRADMGLELLDPEDPASTELIINTILSGIEDLKAALDHVRAASDDYRVDPDRIVVGGWSAGAVLALNVAYGMRAPVAGVLSMSGELIGFKITESVTNDPDVPPLHVIMASHDKTSAQASGQALVDLFTRVGAPASLAWVTGFGHCYPSSAISLGEDGSVMSLETRMIKFMAATGDA